VAGASNRSSSLGPVVTGHGQENPGRSDAPGPGAAVGPTELNVGGIAKGVTLKPASRVASSHLPRRLLCAPRRL
jgi:hypothetical protein